MVLKASAAKRTLDNITGVLIAFENFNSDMTHKEKVSYLNHDLK